MMMMVPIDVTAALKVIEHGDDIHNEQHPLPPCVVHVTLIGGDGVGVVVGNVVGILIGDGVGNLVGNRVGCPIRLLKLRTTVPLQELLE